MDEARTDWRLTSDELKEECLPQELGAYPHWPQGVFIPVQHDFYIVITDPWEAPEEHSDSAVWCTLGVYANDGRNESTMIDLERAKDLESTVIKLLASIKHDDEWLTNAVQYIDQLFDEGKG